MRSYEVFLAEVGGWEPLTDSVMIALYKVALRSSVGTMQSNKVSFRYQPCHHSDHGGLQAACKARSDRDIASWSLIYFPLKRTTDCGPSRYGSHPWGLMCVTLSLWRILRNLGWPRARRGLCTNVSRLSPPSWTACLLHPQAGLSNKDPLKSI